MKMTPDKRFELTHPFRAIYWRARILLLALRWIPKFCLGDEVVTCTGLEYTLFQGVSAPEWEMYQGSHEDGSFRIVRLHERYFMKKRTLRNYWRSFRSGHRFYMTSWYAIWMRQGIKPWMLGCNIWAKR